MRDPRPLARWYEYPTLTVVEAAEILRCSTTWIRKLVKQGKLAKMLHPGRTMLIVTDSLVLYTKGLADDPPADPKASADAADLLRRLAD